MKGKYISLFLPLSANGPEANGEEDLARVILRALDDEDNGDVCRLELKFGDDGEL